jgi:IS5 family transposase
MENRHGLAVATSYTPATGTAEREEAKHLMKEVKGERTGQITMGGDKGYDTKDCVEELREIGVTPHVAQNNTNRSSAIDERTTRHPGYAISQWKRKRIEELFGWGKTVGLLRKMRHRGVALGKEIFTFTLAVFNLIRIRNILQQT